MNNRRRLIIVLNRNLVYGGVELLNETLINFAKENNLEPVSCHLEEVNEIARPSDYIYIQVEGRLSGAFRDSIEPVLDKGCLVFEKNVFALHSKFRPNHKNYFMILMSHDGLYRFKIREFLHLKRYLGSILVVPNLQVKQLEYKREPSQTHNNLNLYKVFRILRVGRPDIKKFSDFEIKFAQELAIKLPRMKVILTLVGAPEVVSRSIGSAPENLEIQLRPYGTDIAEQYKNADLYLQYSKIGETFGHTFFEARKSGLACLGVFDLKWDCAPIEYLSEEMFFVSRAKALENPLDAIETALSLRINHISDLEFLEVNQSLFNRNREELIHRKPSLLASLKHLKSCSEILGIGGFRYFHAFFFEITKEILFKLSELKNSKMGFYK